MPSSIQTLPPEVVHLIAAGEVIDSTSAVVRELVENSLDAGATRIVVSLWPELWRVRVADNGTGIDLPNLQLAAAAHSTSKIRDRDDLWKITSLGFRGEALHSLTQLSSLEILSRAAGGGEAWRVVYNSLAEPVQVEPVAIAPGTVVTVSNLFGTMPVRRQGLPSPAQQLRSVQLTIHQIALCHPHVTWQVHKDDRPFFSISPGPTAQQILPQIIRDVRLSDLEHLSLVIGNPPLFPPPYTGGDDRRRSDNSLHLVIGLPDRCHRQRPDWVKVAVNGRLVRSPELEQTIISAFGRTLPRDRYPLCFLHLQISPAQIDWNRHPAKAEIYLHNLKWWQEQVTGAIQQALRLNVEAAPAVAEERVAKLLKASEARGGYSVSRSIQAEPATVGAKGPHGRGTPVPTLELRATAQVHNTYILAEHPSGVWLVEQHIAHERVLYEQLCDRWQLVPLEPPVILSQLAPAQLEQLDRLGIEVDPFGDQLWAIRSAPTLLAGRDDCSDALLELSLGGDLQTAQVATACRSAIRNGTPLTLPQMQTLLDQWQLTRNPRTCPHGRPIYLSLEESDLARFFRRNWVIGKSHGI